MVQQTLKSDFGAAWLLRLMAAARPAASTEHRWVLRMVEPPVRESTGRSARRFPTDGARSPGLLSRRVTSKEVANSRTSHPQICDLRIGTLVSYCKLWCRDPAEAGCSCTTGLLRTSCQLNQAPWARGFCPRQSRAVRPGGACEHRCAALQGAACYRFFSAAICM